jgi:L-ascorbate metabolism protein UlaG (beta-lactamase superfamily)
MEADEPAVRLLRHATLRIRLGDQNLLVDPMLSEPEAMPPIPNSPNDRRNPLVPLPEPNLEEVDGLLVTHTHRDHLDDAAKDTLPKNLPLFCQPADEAELAQDGFEDIRPIDESESWDTVEFARTGGRHGTGEIGDQMGPVSGFVMQVDGGPTLYLAGDTLWYPEVEDTIATHNPDKIVVNTGEAQFVESDPITMTKEGVAAVCRAAPEATVVAVHMDSINHCLLSRTALRSYLTAEGPEDRVRIPADGEWV